MKFKEDTIRLEKNNSTAYAVNCFFQGLKMLKRPELRKYLVIPVLINLFLYSIAFTLGYFYISELISQSIPVWLSWLEWIIWPLLFISFSIAAFFTFTIFANLLASPFYSQLSTKTLEVLSGKANKIEQQPVPEVVLAGIKRIIYMTSRMIPLLILFIIPVVNLVAPLLWALFAAWAIGLEYMAYPLENQGVLFAQQKEQAKTRRIAVLSFGGLTVTGLSIPVINLIIAPASVIGATVYIHGISEQCQNY